VKNIPDQLARTKLLPDDLAAAILAGNTPPLEELVTNLLISEMDAEAMTASDPSSSWTEKRLARQCLAMAFLLALHGSDEPGADHDATHHWL